MDKALNLASLAMLDYPCAELPYLDALNKPYHARPDGVIRPGRSIIPP